MPTCHSCGKSVRPSDKFCGHCGTESPATSRGSFCSQCGSEVPKGANFCGSCGAGSNSQAAPPGASNPPPMTAAPGQGGKPGRLWPESGLGWMIYLIVIGGAAFFGFQLSQDVDNAAPGWEGKEWMIAPMVAGIGLIILTIWRNIFIAAGVLSREVPVGSAVPGEAPAKKGGINWIGIILVMVSVGVFRHCTQEMTRKMQIERMNKQRQESLEQRRKVLERTRTNPPPGNSRYEAWREQNR